MWAVVAGVGLFAVRWLVAVGGGGALYAVVGVFSACFCWFHRVPSVMVTAFIIAHHGVVVMAGGDMVVGDSARSTVTMTT